MVKTFLYAMLWVSSALMMGLNAAALEATTIPSGTIFHCRLNDTLSTRVNYPGDHFRASVTEPLTLGGAIVIPYGSTLEGRVTELHRPGRVHGVGEMRLVAERLILPDGQVIQLSAALNRATGVQNVKVEGGEGLVKGPSSKRDTAAEVGGLATGGLLVGLLFAHPVVGLTVGGATGFVDRMRRRGKDLSLPQGTQLDYQLTRDLDIPLQVQGRKQMQEIPLLQHR